MRFECDDISAAAKMCSQVNQGRDGGFVWIEAKDNTVSLCARAFDLWVIASVEASTPDHGSACVSARDFAHIARGKMTASLDGPAMKIQSGGRFSLPVTDAGIESPDVPDGVEIDGGLAALRGLAGFCDPNHINPMCHGVGFINGRAIAGNGVVYASVPCGGGDGQIVPASCLRALPKEGRLFLGDDGWRVEAEGLRAGGQVLGDSFPDITKQIGEAESFAQFDADDLRSAISAASLRRAQEVVVEFDGAVARVSGSRFEGAHVDTSAEFGCDASIASCLFSVKQVDKILALYSGKTVTLSCDGRMFKFCPAGTGAFAVVGMLRDPRNSIPGVSND